MYLCIQSESAESNAKKITASTEMWFDFQLWSQNKFKKKCAFAWLMYRIFYCDDIYSQPVLSTKAHPYGFCNFASIEIWCRYRPKPASDCVG
jgi:hypothetical protein